MEVGFGGGFLHKNVYICILLQARVIRQYNGKTLVNTINTTNGDVAPPERVHSGRSVGYPPEPTIGRGGERIIGCFGCIFYIVMRLIGFMSG